MKYAIFIATPIIIFLLLGILGCSTPTRTMNEDCIQFNKCAELTKCLELEDKCDYILKEFGFTQDEIEVIGCPKHPEGCQCQCDCGCLAQTTRKLDYIKRIINGELRGDNLHDLK